MEWAATHTHDIKHRPIKGVDRLTKTGCASKPPATHNDTVICSRNLCTKKGGSSLRRWRTSSSLRRWRTTLYAKTAGCEGPAGATKACTYAAAHTIISPLDIFFILVPVGLTGECNAVQCVRSAGIDSDRG